MKVSSLDRQRSSTLVGRQISVVLLFLEPKYWRSITKTVVGFTFLFSTGRWGLSTRRDTCRTNLGTLCVRSEDWILDTVLKHNKFRWFKHDETKSVSPFNYFIIIVRVKTSSFTDHYGLVTRVSGQSLKDSVIQNTPRTLGLTNCSRDPVRLCVGTSIWWQFICLLI